MITQRQRQLAYAARAMLGAWDALETEDGGEPSAALREAMRGTIEEVRACLEAVEQEDTGLFI